MLTLGIDLSAQPDDTVACQVLWQECHARVLRFVPQATDAKLVDLMRKADKIGIDVPLGWPDAFVKAVSQYQRGERWPATPVHKLRLRAADDFFGKNY